MNFTNVFFRGDCKVAGLYNSTKNVFTPVLSHAFFIIHLQVLHDEFWIYGNKFNKHKPECSNLPGKELYILCNYAGHLQWITLAGRQAFGNGILQLLMRLVLHQLFEI